MKNPNGLGTVIKLSGKRRKPYAAVITVGWIQYYDDNGFPKGSPKQKRKYLGYYEKRYDALLALNKYAKMHENNSNEVLVIQEETSLKTLENGLKRYAPTFEQCYKEIIKLKENELSDSSLTNYRICFEHCKKIHSKRIDELTYKDLQLVMNEYSKQGKTKGSLKLMKNTMTMIFNYAVKMGYISSNIAQFVEYKATKENKEKRALSSDEIKIIDSHKELRSHDIVMILIYSGMRIQELLRVKPEDYHDTYIVGGEKTENGKNRIIPIHPYIHDMLYKFIHINHSVAYDTYKNIIRRDIEKYEINAFTSHECRHTFVSLANKYNIDLYALKKIVGHSTTDITERVYTHIEIETLCKEIRKIPNPNNL